MGLNDDIDGAPSDPVGVLASKSAGPHGSLGEVAAEMVLLVLPPALPPPPLSPLFCPSR